MTAAHAVLLLAIICSTAREPGRWDACEQAEAHLRQGLRAAQSLRVLSCEVRP